MESGVRRVVGRHALHYGLNWKLLSTDDVLPRIWARQEARKNGARFGVLKPRDDGAVRLGLLAGSGIKGPIYSGAQWLAERAQSTTLAMVYLGDSVWWICRAERGEVLADEVVSHGRAVERVEEETQELLSLVLTGGERDPPAIYLVGDRAIDTKALSRLASEGYVHRKSVDDLFDSSTPPPEAEIRQLVGLKPRTIAVMIGAVVALAGAYGGYVAWEIRVEAARQEAERQAAILREAEAARLRTLAQVRALQAVKQALQEDTATPMPMDVVRNCLSTVSRVGDRYAGWRVERVECDPSGMSALFNLRIATGQTGFEPTASLLSVAADNGHEATTDSTTGTASVRIELATPVARTPAALAQLPRLQALQSGTFSRLEVLQHVNRGTTVAVTAPTARPIRFAAPEHDATPDHPERWIQVPPEKGYSTGGIRISGQSLGVLGNLGMVEPFTTIRKLGLQPSGAGDWNWEMETTYVAAAL
jgi:hypothetical protein